MDRFYSLIYDLDPSGKGILAMPKPIADAQSFFSGLKALLELETETEKRQFLERLQKQTPKQRESNGSCLHSLTVEDEFPGLGGRFIIVLRKSSRAPLPWTSMDAGSPVILSTETSQPTWSARAVVVERQPKAIHIALEEPLPDVEDSLLQLDVSFDESTRRKERQALDQVMNAQKQRLAELRDIFLGKRAPAFRPLAADPARLPQLNAQQEEAVRFALEAEDIAIIHGPPGTGKTTTLVEIIQLSIQAEGKILVTASSNLGVDNLLEKLVQRGMKAVRLGHPARVMESLRPWSLDYLVEKHEDARLAQKLMKEASIIFQKARRYTRAPPAKGEKQALWSEAKAMMADARQLEARAVERVLDDAEIICATTTGLDSFLLGKRRFSLVVLDEAGQSTEPNSWIPLLRGDKLICGGDHCQLPPTVLSQEAAQKGLEKSLMERLVSLYGQQITRRLDVQYRMHEKIMSFSSQEFYENSLIAAPAVQHHRLEDLHGIKAAEELPVILFIDTAGAGFQEEFELDSGSRFNPKEAAVIEQRTAQLLGYGLGPEQIAIITPYAAQARLLRERCGGRGIEVDTIDGFQGREKEAVLISLVRSNDEQDIGFLRETRRINVALTRARRQLIVVGDSATLGLHPFYQRLLQYFESTQSYRSVWEESPELIEH